MKKRSKFIRGLAIVYGVFVSLIGLPAFIAELVTLPGAYKVLALSWVPLLGAYWLFVKHRFFGRQSFWQWAAVLVVVSDVFLNLYVGPVVMHEPALSVEALFGLALLIPLYGAMLYYAFGRNNWKARAS